MAKNYKDRFDKRAKGDKSNFAKIENVCNDIKSCQCGENGNETDESKLRRTTAAELAIAAVTTESIVPDWVAPENVSDRRENIIGGLLKSTNAAYNTARATSVGSGTGLPLNSCGVVFTRVKRSKAKLFVPTVRISSANKACLDELYGTDTDAPLYGSKDEKLSWFEADRTPDMAQSLINAINRSFLWGDYGNAIDEDAKHFTGIFGQLKAAAANVFKATREYDFAGCTTLKVTGDGKHLPTYPSAVDLIAHLSTIKDQNGDLFYTIVSLGGDKYQIIRNDAQKDLRLDIFCGDNGVCDKPLGYTTIQNAMPLTAGAPLLELHGAVPTNNADLTTYLLGVFMAWNEHKMKYKHLKGMQFKFYVSSDLLLLIQASSIYNAQNCCIQGNVAGAAELLSMMVVEVEDLPRLSWVISSPENIVFLTSSEYEEAKKDTYAIGDNCREVATEMHKVAGVGFFLAEAFFTNLVGTSEWEGLSGTLTPGLTAHGSCDLEDIAECCLPPNTASNLATAKVTRENCDPNKIVVTGTSPLSLGDTVISETVEVYGFTAASPATAVLLATATNTSAQTTEYTIQTGETPLLVKYTATVQDAVGNTTVLGATTIYADSFEAGECGTLPFAVIGGKIQYDPQTKKAVLVPDGASGLGVISVSAINWTSFGGATVTTTNVANDTLDFATDPLFNGAISVDFTVTSGAATSTARSTALVSVPDNAAYIFATPLFSMATLGQLQITGGSTIVGAVFADAVPVEEGYNLNGTGNTVFTSTTTITVANGNSLEYARSETNNGYNKNYNKYYIYF